MAKTVNFTVKLNISGKNNIADVSHEIQYLSKETDIAKSKAEKLSTTLVAFGQLQMSFQNLQNGLQSVTNVLNNLTEESRTFSTAMKAANTMAGKDAAGFEKLKGQVTELSKVIPLTRDELARGLYQVISNGVPEDNWINYLEASSRAAVGGIANLEEVVKVTATVIKNYGLEWSAAQDIQDKIQLTAKNGVTSFEQLASALPSVTGQAAQLGVSFTEMLAVMSTLTGVTGETSEVATQLGSVLTALTKESSKSQKMADAMGISFNAASVKAAGGLRNYLQQLDRTVTSYSQKTGELKESIYSKLFGRAEALRLVNALTGNLSEKFNENIQSLDASAGTINSVFDEMASTGAAKFQMLKNAWGGLVDHVQGAVGVISPILNFATQIGMTTMAVMSLSKAFAFLKTTTVASTIAAGAHNAVTKVGALLQKIWAAQLYQARRAQLAWAFGAKLCVVQATALRIALLAAIPMGIGLVIAGVTALMGGFGNSMKEATGKAKGLENALETKAAAEEEGTRVAAEARVEVDKDIKKLDELIKSKADTRDAVKQLNDKYGEWFGHCKTAQQWYDILTAKSQAYCLQLGYEAQMRVYQEKKAQLQIKQLRNQQQQDELKKSGKDKEARRNAGSYANGGFSVGGKDLRETNEQKTLRLAGEQIGAELAEVDKDITATETLMENNKKNFSNTPPPPPPGSGASDKKGGKTNTGKHDKKDTDKHLIANAKTYEQLSNNVAYYQQQIDRANVSDEAAIKALVEKKKAAEDEVKAFTDMVEAVGVPTDLKSLDDYDKKLQWLRKQRQEADKDAIAGIDAQIASLEKERQVLEDTGVAAMRDDEIKTYDDLNRKLAYYNGLLDKGDESQRKMTQKGINQLSKMKEAWDKVLEEQSLPTTTNTIADIDKMVSFYSSRQQTEDADQIEATQRLIDKLEAKKKSLSLGTELPGMQKEITEMEALGKREFKMKIRDYGFDELTAKIRDLQKLLADTENPVTDSQRKEIEGMIATYEQWRKQGVLSFGTMRQGWDGVKGIGDSVSSITSALESNGDAWQTVTGLIDGMLSIYDSVNGIITIIQMLTAVSQAHATAKTVEAGATIAAGTAETASAAGAETAAAAEVPLIVANKATAQSFMEMASAAYFAAHAAIPFAGYGIGAGFSAAAMATVQAIGVTPFAEGGIVSGKTLGLIGEYAGASHNPEVVAPLDKLRGMLQTPQVMLPPGSIVGKLKGNDIVLVAANASRTRARSGHRSNIV